MLYCTDTKEQEMLKLIGLVTVIYLLFYFGIVQLVALWGVVALSWVAGL